jgi:peptidoglycan LD-endopeptidase LytH
MVVGSWLSSANTVRVTFRRLALPGVALIVALSAAAALAVPGRATPSGAVPQLIFPVVGPVTYRDDFGEPRAHWPHPGNDLMASKRQIAVAAEPGKIMFWTHSATAGCMLYLYGKSGTTYQYIHLNNDLTTGNDNQGQCVAGTAYAPGLKDGATVQAGQAVGFVGDSGDANGIHPHLHFEVHPNDGGPVDPYPYLRKAVHLLVPVDPKTTVSLSVEGKVTASTGSRVTLAVSSLTLFPASQKLTGVVRTIVLSVPSSAQVDAGNGTLGSAGSTDLAALDGKNVVVLTTPAKATLAVALARPGAISASRIATVTPAAAGGP